MLYREWSSAWARRVQAGTDILGDGLQPRQKVLQRLRLVETRHVQAQAHGSGDLTVTVVNRHREPANPELELLLDEAPALPARSRHFVADPVRLGFRVSRDLRQFCAREKRLELPVTEVGEHDPPH